jgi:hypothetical protein
MIQTLRFFAMGVFVIGLLLGFYLLPGGEVISEPGNSPLYSASLTSTTDQLSGVKDTPRGSDSKGGGEGNFITCEVTCGPTCNQQTCGSTCVATCASTCANTCSQPTCESTCVATCVFTCANTCSQPTCESTCVITCSFTCQVPITLSSLIAQVDGNAIAIRWTTASEVENYHFELLRSTDANGGFSQIASIPASAGVGNRDYTYVDRDVTPGTTYYYMIQDRSIYGYPTLHQNVVSATIAGEFGLAQNYPNPFNPETSIRFALPVASQTRLTVYDMSGRLVRTLVNGNLPAGSHEISWNATDEAGNILPSGMYIYRLTSGELNASGKMLFVK